MHRQQHQHAINAPFEEEAASLVGLLSTARATDASIEMRSIEGYLEHRIPALPTELPDGDESVSSATAAVASTTAVAAAASAAARLRPRPPRRRRRAAALPPIDGPTPLGRSMGPMTAEEERLMFLDVYGRKLPAVELRERRLADLERAISRLSPDERASLNRALVRQPLLTVSGPHVRLLTQADDFDPGEASRRLAWYWRQREALFGERAFSEGVFTDPTYNDYMTYYAKCERAMSDDASDHFLSEIAKRYVQCVHQTKIVALDHIIDAAAEEDKEALLDAWECCPEVACSDEHKLLFLKCDDFVEVKAAVRLMKYWACKRMLFGPECLRRDIILDDVKRDVFDPSLENLFRVMPETDKGGRSVIVVTLTELEKKGWTERGMARYLWFVMHLALARQSPRPNGYIVLVDFRSGTRELYRSNSSIQSLFAVMLVRSIPLRLCATHCFFSPSTWWRSVMTSALKKASKTLRRRIVVHLGNNEENRNVLEKEYGILPSGMPEDLGGDVTTEWWRNWVRNEGAQGGV